MSLIKQQSCRRKNHKPLSLSMRFIPVLILISIVSSACSLSDFTPPREVDLSSEQPIVSSNAEPMILPAPTATKKPENQTSFDPQDARSLNIWVNETSAEHEEALNRMINNFSNESGIEVSYQLVSPNLLPDLMHTAVLSNTLPDIVLHPLEYTAAWQEEGLLDAGAANRTLEQIGRDTFNQDALNLVDAGGQIAAIPSDGYKQIWLYRSDWFEEKDLDTPDNFDDMMTAAETLFDPENLISGLVIPTESNLINTHRAFEHLALANGCQLFDESGEVILLDDSCREALDYYFSIVHQFSPTGVQTDTSAWNAFIDGRTSMIMTSPSILPELYGTNRMDLQTGIITDITGNGPDAGPANFSLINFLGITPVADEEAAAAFADYWFNEGYSLWLGVDSERKVPMRFGTDEEPDKFFQEWGNSPIVDNESLADIYGVDTVSLLRDDIANTNRWGIRDGHDDIVGKIYEELTLSIVLQEMLSGYFNSEKTLYEAANRVVELIPNYQFTLEPAPTVEPEEE